MYCGLLHRWCQIETVINDYFLRIVNLTGVLSSTACLLRNARSHYTVWQLPRCGGTLVQGHWGEQNADCETNIDKETGWEMAVCIVSLSHHSNILFYIFDSSTYGDLPYSQFLTLCLKVEVNSPADLAGLCPEKDYLLGTAEKVSICSFHGCAFSSYRMSQCVCCFVCLSVDLFLKIWVGGSRGRE